MADTHPEDEGGDVHAPEDRRVVPGVTQPVLDEDEEGQDPGQEERDGSEEQEHVAPARRAQGGDDVAGDVGVGLGHDVPVGGGGGMHDNAIG